MSTTNSKTLAAYLKIQQILLVKMIQIFQELGFVTIENGIMKVNKEAENEKSQRAASTKTSNKPLKNRELMALGTVHWNLRLPDRSGLMKKHLKNFSGSLLSYFLPLLVGNLPELEEPHGRN